MTDLITKANESNPSEGSDVIVEYELNINGKIQAKFRGPMSWVDTQKTDLSKLMLSTLPQSESGKSEVHQELPQAQSKDSVSRFCKQHSVDVALVGEIFDLTDEVPAIIAHDLPGSTRKEKVQNLYLLAGLAMLFSTGEAKFSDEFARESCKEFGIYDSGNHSSYLKGIRQCVRFDKSEGNRLTQPGLRMAADIVKKMLDEKVM